MALIYSKMNQENQLDAVEISIKPTHGGKNERIQN